MTKPIARRRTKNFCRKAFIIIMLHSNVAFVRAFLRHSNMLSLSSPININIKQKQLRTACYHASKVILNNVGDENNNSDNNNNNNNDNNNNDDDRYRYLIREPITDDELYDKRGWNDKVNGTDEDDYSLTIDEDEQELQQRRYYGLIQGDEIAESIKNAKTLDEYFEMVEKETEEMRQFLKMASFGQSTMDAGRSFGQMSAGEAALDLVKRRQLYIQQRVTHQADLVVNLASTKQVAKLLYGDNAGGSTDKYTLETRFASNPIARDILRWRELEVQRRKLTQRVKKMKESVKSLSSYERRRMVLDERPNSLGSPFIRTKRSYSSVSDFANDTDSQDPLILVDTSGFIFRAYHALPPLHRGDGEPVGAVLGLCNMFSRFFLPDMIEGSKNPRVVLVFDHPGKNFRHDIYEEYKANRGPCPEDLVPQFDYVRQAAQAYGIPYISSPGFEADDVIATLATMAFNDGVDVDIYSSDKDLMQLCTEEGVSPKINMVDPFRFSRTTHKEVFERWGVSSNLLGDLLALAGDSSDNIPGVKGIGPKIGASLLNDYGNLEAVLEQAHNIKQKSRREKLIEYADMARLSRKLVELDRNAPIQNDHILCNGVTQIRTANLDKARLLNFLDKMEFRELKKKTIRKLGRST